MEKMLKNSNLKDGSRSGQGTIDVGGLNGVFLTCGSWQYLPFNGGPRIW